MLTLAIDTATKVCSVALCRDGEITAEYNINMGMTHSEGLLPQLEQLLKRTNTKKQDMTIIMQLYDGTDFVMSMSFEK